MPLYILKRVAQLVPLLLVIAFVVFVALQMAPGDPVTLLLGQNATPSEVAKVNRHLGLDRPLVVQYSSRSSGTRSPETSVSPTAVGAR